ncbi:MAG: DUF4190 domain-containing protein [Flavobacteriales bacterium]|nr:DUF4190 domain-containing protein [Flavobacteriales bacterium]
MKNIHSLTMLCTVLTVLVLSSCGSLEITKRRHLPGYHVELGHHRQDRHPAVETAAVAPTADTAPEAMGPNAGHIAIPTAYNSAAPEMDGSLTASTAKGIAPAAAPSKFSKKLASLADELVVQPLKELRTEKVGRELRRSVFPEEGDEKYGWSVVGIIAMALSLVAFIMLLAGIIGLITGSGFWFVPLILGFIFGLVGMILGIVGLRQTKSGGKKGRGFAIVGMILGIVSFAISLIALVVGLVINLNNGNGLFGI